MQKGLKEAERPKGPIRSFTEITNNLDKTGHIVSLLLVCDPIVRKGQKVPFM